MSVVVSSLQVYFRRRNIYGFEMFMNTYNVRGDDLSI